MRYLVTGGAGFIGSHICEQLVARGARVGALDDLSTGRRENLAGLIDNPRFELHVGSVTDAPLVEELMAETDIVLHLAAAVGVQLVLDEPVRTLETNVQGSTVVLDAAVRRGARVLFASSSEVYGKSNRVPFREDDPVLLGSPTEPRWSYACSKAMTESLALARSRQEGLDVTIVRLFNTVGPRQRGRWGMVLPRFARQALEGQPITVYGDGDQTRSFIYVGDTVEACLRLLDRPHPTPRVFNVGSEREVTIAELAEMVRRQAGSTSPIVHLPYREAYGTAFHDFRRRRPDAGRLRETCDFVARTSLEEIVTEVLADIAERCGSHPGRNPASASTSARAPGSG
jgi:UDP-glucose 4-epimerase